MSAVDATIRANAFALADPRATSATLDDAIHLWRLPWRREDGRAPLLDLLSKYLDVDVGQLDLTADEYGKPRLSGERTLHFNWSHSGRFALVALSRIFEVGVDIEEARPGVRALELARRFFAPGEAEALAAFEESVRDDAFLRLWCAKEAVLKALGRGLAFGLERVEFAESRQGWQPARFDEEAGAPSDWQIRSLRPAPNCAGALAWRGPPVGVVPLAMP